ncbi:uncharacterized protein LOC106162037 isoform X2 [Lingula anatina]|uniref:Uncharacterized protein LOC106162037 isoform X2 n=1 Tax=Lingula anatina TaxID=7574 RepID=A0A1S3I8M1_LINAN|nr:uncharacterized protein LOC106162037 isoform X2 [Lingula anatina]|eukprot:XP_013394597.1 uncharacterized protein LOC106162037 isoform X2 [Lingula anatina]
MPEGQFLQCTETHTVGVLMGCCASKYKKISPRQDDSPRGKPPAQGENKSQHSVQEVNETQNIVNTEAGTIYPFMGNACACTTHVNVCPTICGNGYTLLNTTARSPTPRATPLRQEGNSNGVPNGNASQSTPIQEPEPSHEDTVVKGTQDDPARNPTPRGTPSGRGGNSNGVPNGNASQSTPIQEPEPSRENTPVKGIQDDPARSPTSRATPPEGEGNSNGGSMGNASQSRVPTPAPIQESEPNHDNTHVKSALDDPGDARIPIQETSKNK